MKNILLVGSGAREQAIAKAIKRSATRANIFCVGTHYNPGILPLCEDYHLLLNGSFHKICEYAKIVAIDFAIIGPEGPLAGGLVDLLRQNDIQSIGPTQMLAQIETSKSFARQLLQHYHISGQPHFQDFKSMDGMADFLSQLGENYVIKADGLMGGKGVKVSGEHLHSHTEALQYAKMLLNQDQSVLIEEKFVGKEFSLLSFSDGYHLQHMPVVQDHKRAYENDTGPNTGGMGTYSCADHRLPFLSPLALKQAQEINQATVAALKNHTKQAYQGILYGGYMLTASGVKLIEFNARFGDPEAMNLLGLLESDFLEICEAILRGSLNQISLRFKNEASLCQYIVPEGYPDSPVKGKFIDISTLPKDTDIYYASVEKNSEGLQMLGSRALALLSLAPTVTAARAKLQIALSNIKGPVFYRKDLGTSQWWEKKLQ
jgi:fusion protein PurCD